MSDAAKIYLALSSNLQMTCFRSIQRVFAPWTLRTVMDAHYVFATLSNIVLRLCEIYLIKRSDQSWKRLRFNDGFFPGQ